MKKASSFTMSSFFLIFLTFYFFNITIQAQTRDCLSCNGLKIRDIEQIDESADLEDNDFSWDQISYRTLFSVNELNLKIQRSNSQQLLGLVTTISSEYGETRIRQFTDVSRVELNKDQTQDFLSELGIAMIDFNLSLVDHAVHYNIGIQENNQDGNGAGITAIYDRHGQLLSKIGQYGWNIGLCIN